MRWTPRRAVLFAAAGSLLSGCVSTSTMGLARTLPAGKVQGMVNPGLVTYSSSTDGMQTGTIHLPAILPGPQLELGLRLGVTDHVELGAKTWLAGGTVDAKVAVVRPDSAERGLNVALAPGISVSQQRSSSGSFVDGRLMTLYLPVLFGLRVNQHELVFAPKAVGMWALTPAGPSAGALWAGASLGFAVRVSPQLRLMPELSWLQRVVDDGRLETPSVVGADGVAQVGLGFLVGGD